MNDCVSGTSNGKSLGHGDRLRNAFKRRVNSTCLDSATVQASSPQSALAYKPPPPPANMKMLVAFLILGCVASSRAIFFDLFKKETQQADPWPVQPADPWAQPADPWVQQPVSAWAKPSFQPVIKEVPIYIPYPKLEPVPISKPLPIFKPEFVEAQIPIYKPQIGLPNKFFNFNANLGLQKQPQYHQQVHHQEHHLHQPSAPSTAYEAPDAHLH
ncbi:uncharacterized protein LOC122253010 [Penaeus japonicus]|uniref:uncharacterized protein LOC122253010 n=1 Tax=Penaeus japonicus TaxID=27405 RepID=UPI001C70BF54|nr:uncharacterized protein LOC122253010 [Penaeus japonicus]